MNVFGNIQFTLRLFFKNLSTSLIAVLVLSIGLAMSLTMFNLSKMIMWDNPQFTDGEELVAVDWIRSFNPNGQNQEGVNILDYEYFANNNSSFNELAAFHSLNYSVYHPGSNHGVVRYQAGRVSGNFFSMLNVQPLMGRLPVLADAEASAGDMVLIGYKVWQQEFDGSEDVIGETLLLDGTPHQVIGVMPDNFSFPFSQQIWKPYNWRWEKDGRDNEFKATLLGTLKPGVSKDQARMDLETMASHLREQFPEHNKDLVRLSVNPYGWLIANEQVRALMFMVLIGSLFVLMIASANVSNLLLARVSKRQFELSMRKVLGASRREISMQVVLDALLIAFFGFVLAFLMASWASRIIWGLLYEQYGEFLPYWWSMDIDIKVFVFGICVVLLAVLVSSLSAIIKISGRYNNDSLKDNSRTSSSLSSSRAGNILMSVQIGLTVILIVTASFFGLTVSDALDRQLPWQPEKILQNMLYVTHEAGYDSEASVQTFYDSVEREVAAIPGIRHVAYAYTANLAANLRSVEIEGQTTLSKEDLVSVNSNIVSEQYFELHGKSPVQGRFFLKTDDADSRPVVVINQNFANEFFPGQNPIGKRLRLMQPGNTWEPQNRDKDDWTPWMTVVGVTPALISTKGYENARASGTTGPYLSVYLNNRQWISRVMNVLVTADGRIENYAQDVSQAIASQSTKMAPLGKYQTIAGLIEQNDMFARLIMNFIISFAVVALLMAAAGLYGIASFTAQQRQREYGIHMALGANKNNVVMLVLKTVRWQLGIGLFFGLLISDVLGRVMEQALGSGPNGIVNSGFEVNAYLVYAGTLVLVTLVLGLALLVPALRTASIKPNIALRAYA
ncbi:ABC transporter permease [Agaribacterium haliotis]|uniref:ABC transporter permease n=1 Tax=Agaribacterium haliotis TaxID=2013869 RepID=UPI000BB58611|nr:ABC transporter permease [Agaribacterium haliotis]